MTSSEQRERERNTVSSAFRCLCCFSIALKKKSKPDFQPLSDVTVISVYTIWTNVLSVTYVTQVFCELIT